VNILPVEESVPFLYQNGDDILESLLGSINYTIRTIDSDVCESLMYHISDYISTLYYNFKHQLQFKIPLILHSNIILCCNVSAVWLIDLPVCIYVLVVCLYFLFDHLYCFVNFIYKM